MATAYINGHGHIGQVGSSGRISNSGYYAVSVSNTIGSTTMIDNTVRIPKGSIVEGYIRLNDMTNAMEVYSNGSWRVVGFMDRVESVQERHERLLKELAEFWPDAYFDLGMKGLI